MTPEFLQVTYHLFRQLNGRMVDRIAKTVVSSCDAKNMSDSILLGYKFLINRVIEGLLYIYYIYIYLNYDIAHMYVYDMFGYWAYIQVAELFANSCQVEKWYTSSCVVSWLPKLSPPRCAAGLYWKTNYKGQEQRTKIDNLQFGPKLASNPVKFAKKTLILILY